MKSSKVYLKKRLLYFVIVSCVVVGALISVRLYLSYFATNKSSEVALAKQYLAFAEDIKNGIDRTHVDEYRKSHREEARMEIKAYLEEYRQRIHARYVYILTLDESDVSKVLISSHPPDAVELPVGAPCTVPPAQVNQAKRGKSYYTGIMTVDNDGMEESYLSVGVPLHDQDGSLLGVIGIDIDARDLEYASNEVMRGNPFIFGIDVLFALTLLTAIFMLNKWYRLRLRRSLQESEQLYISELGKVIGTIKSSRHDLLNHFQVISGLLQMNYVDQAQSYLRNLSIDTKVLDWTVRIKNPILMVLFQSKWELAKSRGIHMEFDADQDEYRLVESMDLVKIFSNLLDNAIEALELYEGDLPKLIHVTCRNDGEKYVFAVQNPAELTVSDQKNFFQYGYTTKENAQDLRGNGLLIVLNTVDKYKGSIHFTYEEGQVLIQIKI
ncbi:GHKL domain-containing protein [Paenibacillus terrigena]|uniref:GHKL domain-containing protein n=1 Tax=Paenibacillus terrigena TaxID=369333 RepID=UPI0028D4C5FA|nr:GHKL domain-containing protein [Paenibacillus terrigena]